MQYLAADRSISGQRPPPPDPTELIGDLVQGIVRRWRLVLLVALLLVGAVYVLMQARSDIYEVEARLLVKVGPENVDLPVTVSNGAMVSSGVRKEDINSDVILLQSRYLVEYAVDTLGVDAFKVDRPRPTTLIGWLRRGASVTVRAISDGLEALFVALRLTTPLSDRDEIVMKISDNLLVKREGESDVIFLSLELGSAARAVDVLNLMLDRFMLDRAQARRTLGTLDFFHDQVAQTRTELEAVDRQLADLRRSYRLTSIDEERRLLLERAAVIRSDIIEAELARESVVPLQGLAKAVDQARVDRSIGGAGFRDVRDSISELMVKRTGEMGEVSASGKAARELEEKIGALVILLERAVTQEIDKRQSELATLEARLEDLNQAEQALRVLMDDRATVQARLDDHATRLETERVNVQMQEARVANVVLLNPPSAPIEPSGPARLMTSLVSVPLGLILGVLLAGVLAYADPRLQSARQAARIPGLAVLGEMPRRAGRA